MESRVEVYQLLSRPNIQNGHICTRRTWPKQRPDLALVLDCEICDRPSEITFAQVSPSKPSLGAHERVGQFSDAYTKRRWPKCIRGVGRVEIPAKDIGNTEVIRQVLALVRLNLWTLGESSAVLKEQADQLTSVGGYRREFFDKQSFDIAEKSSRYSSMDYVPASEGEYAGPGLSCIPDISPAGSVNEMVWGQVISFPSRSTMKIDLPVLLEKASRIGKHYSTYLELDTSRHLLRVKHVKACIRAAAKAVDSILRYYCGEWNVRMSARSHPLDDRIETILARASRPSYRRADADNLQKLLYLYRAARSAGKAGCCYTDGAGDLTLIQSQEDAESFVEAAEVFTLWIDSLA